MNATQQTLHQIGMSLVDIAQFQAVLHPLDAAVRLRRISTELRRAADDLVGENTQALIDRIIAVVAAEWTVAPEDILSHRRPYPLAQARQAAMALVLRYTALPRSAVGRVFGNRCASTVLHSTHAVSDAAETDPVFRARFARCSSVLETHSPSPATTEPIDAISD